MTATLRMKGPSLFCCSPTPLCPKLVVESSVLRTRCHYADSPAGERIAGRAVGPKIVNSMTKWAAISDYYFTPLLSSFELYLLPFLPFILDLVEAGFGLICVNLYCLFSIFLIYLLFSRRNNRPVNYTTKDKRLQKVLRWPDHHPDIERPLSGQRAGRPMFFAKARGKERLILKRLCGFEELFFS